MNKLIFFDDCGSYVSVDDPGYP